MPSANAPQAVRNLVDMADAEAQAAMKKAVEIDALADLELQAAEQINQQLQSAAPGTATILESETAAWLVRANAYTQSAMAELVRVRSVELANQSGQFKFAASHTATLQGNGSQILQQGVQ
jgi:cytidylate kinase